MAGVNVKMGVDVSQFKKGMQEAQSSVKTLDAQLKLNEKQLKATGDAELYAANKSKLLNQQMTEQKKVVANIQKQLEDMKKRGVDEASDAYQKLERAMYNAAGKMMDIQAELNGLADSEGKVADGAKDMADNLASINKKVSFDAVITGVNKITDGIGKAIKGAINLGETLFDEFKDAAKWADDTATMAQMYEVPLDKLLKMQALVGNGMDTSVDAMLGGMQKLKKNVGKESKETLETLQKLGLATTQTIDTGFGKVEQTVKLYGNSDDLFWKAGRALMNMSDAFDKESAAQSLFGKSWRELVPLFSTYSSMEEYNKALEDVTTNSTEAVEALAESSDALAGLETSWKTLKYETLGAIAPAITEAAGVLQQLLDSVTEYLKTDEGKELLKSLGDAVGALFEDLSKIDPEDVVKNFVAVFDQLKNAFLWIKENWNAVKIALEGIVGVWAVGKVVSGATTILNMLNGIKELGGAKGVEQVIEKIASAGGGETAAETAGSTAGGTAGKMGLGAWVTDALGMSGAGLIGGTAATGLIVYFGSKAIADINDEANKMREVAADAERYSNFGKEQANYAWGGLDSRYVLESYVNSLMKTTGDTKGINSPKNILKRMAGGLGSDLLDVFEYTNTSGEKRNKLLDMLNMDDQNAAVAAMMLHAAGISTRDVDYSAQYAKYQELLRSGGMGYSTGLGTLTSFFNASGTWVDGRWTIPGFTNTNGVMPVINGVPLANMSGYVMTSDSNKRQYTGTWDPSELTTKTGDLETTFSGLNETVPVTEEDIRKLGEKSVEAEGHVGEFGERAGGAEGPVTDLGTAAAGAASALASIQAPSLSAFFPWGHANGIWSVPWDGYPAILHKGERVMPAREVASRNYNSNLYVESMYMNNGQDAAGLAAAMAAAQRRTMSGYGS